jgi:hypothetical protein
MYNKGNTTCTNSEEVTVHPIETPKFIPLAVLRCVCVTKSLVIRITPLAFFFLLHRPHLKFLDPSSVFCAVFSPSLLSFFFFLCCSLFIYHNIFCPYSSYSFWSPLWYILIFLEECHRYLHVGVRVGHCFRGFCAVCFVLLVFISCLPCAMLPITLVWQFVLPPRFSLPYSFCCYLFSHRHIVVETGCLWHEITTPSFIFCLHIYFQ